MIVRFANEHDLRVIAANLRPADRAEVLALRFEADTAGLAAQLIERLPAAQLRLTLAADDGAAVAFVGFWLVAPGVGSASLLATPRWDEIARPAHRFCKRTVMGRVAPAAFRRLECRPLASHHVSRAWLKRIGFVEEGPARALGKAGEDFVHCAWVHPAFRLKEA